MRDRLKQIIPGVEVEAVRAMMKEELAEELLAGMYVCRQHSHTHMRKSIYPSPRFFPLHTSKQVVLHSF